ncbi:hypothetical protein [Xanthobacter autotrophicus]|uniref:hypothetical protein n=1 Tax=Xanthobacter autotrophicus TaxID=280 RepID=UPI0024A71DD6|nr:hypothetical protein [Xanthobacter autotrophicus]MDI4656464.1 hypothetical protein [Xanthobacter autotrophicus]
MLAKQQQFTLRSVGVRAFEQEQRPEGVRDIAALLARGHSQSMDPVASKSSEKAIHCFAVEMRPGKRAVFRLVLREAEAVSETLRPDVDLTWSAGQRACEPIEQGRDDAFPEGATIQKLDEEKIPAPLPYLSPGRAQQVRLSKPFPADQEMAQGRYADRRLLQRGFGFAKGAQDVRPLAGVESFHMQNGIVPDAFQRMHPIETMLLEGCQFPPHGCGGHQSRNAK